VFRVLLLIGHLAVGVQRHQGGRIVALDEVMLRGRYLAQRLGFAVDEGLIRHAGRPQATQCVNVGQEQELSGHRRSRRQISCCSRNTHENSRAAWQVRSHRRGPWQANDPSFRPLPASMSATCWSP
jgi:hypothetical protein